MLSISCDKGEAEATRGVRSCNPRYVVPSSTIVASGFLFGFRNFFFGSFLCGQILVHAEARVCIFLRLLPEASGFIRAALGQHLESGFHFHEILHPARWL